MSQRKPPQTNDDWLPESGQLEGTERAARIELGLKPDGRYLQFTMADLDGTGVVGGNAADGFYLAIRPGEKWLLTLTLGSSWSWQFDNAPITFKHQSHAQYYRVISASAKSVVLQARSKHANAGNHPTDLHPFNLYVIMDQSAGKSYPLMIDPDVKNPPPPNDMGGGG